MQPHQQRFEQQLFGPAREQTAAELAEHAESKAGVGQFQSQGIFPVDAATDRLGRLPVGEAFDKLQDENQSESGRRKARLAAQVKQSCELLVLVERTEHIHEVAAKVAFGEGGASDTLGLRRNRVISLWVERHGEFSNRKAATMADSLSSRKSPT